MSANSTLKLLRTVGSPFSSERELPHNSDEALALYNYASKNKIGLTYLEALKSQGSLKKFGLEVEYKEEQQKYNELRITASRISHRLNSHGINYAVFKSIMPFAVVTNDTDILHLGSGDEYKKAVNVMAQSDYTMIAEEGPVPLQVMFHDTRDGSHPILSQKDVYDIDLYREASTSHIVYLDRTKLAKYVTEINVLGEQVKVLKPEADLVAMIVHALLPEVLYTLLVHYATLYYLRDLNSNEFSEFIHIAKENKVIFSVRTHCSITAELHKEAHGFVPDELKEVLDQLGDNSREVAILRRTGFKTPHRYSVETFLGAFIEKTKEWRFLRSAVKQTVATTVNPKLAKRVWENLMWRRSRETY